MITLSFDEEWPYANGSHTITVPIRVENLPYWVPAILDTGASVTYLDNALLPHLHIADVRAGPSIPVTVANGEQGTAFLHSLRIEVFNRQLSIQAAFCPDWPPGTKNLLGMRGFFEQILVAFDHGIRRLYYTIPARPLVWASSASGLVPPV